MKYTYVFLGQGRTGTTSLWRMLRDHPQIAVSIEKEHYQDYITNLEDYHKGFLIKENTKVLLNGLGNSKTACLEFAERSRGERVCCIYVLRDPKERLISYYDLVNKVFQRRNVVHEQVFNNGTIDYKKLQVKLLEDIHEYLYLNEVEEKIGRENIIVFKFGEIEEKQHYLYEFLGVEQIQLKLPKLNSAMSITPTIQSLKEKIEIGKSVSDLFQKTVQQISDEQINLIHERYTIK